MATLSIPGIRVVGVAAAVPSGMSSLAQTAGHFTVEEVAKVSESTGVRTRRLAAPGTCTSDLCLRAAENLLREAGWDRDSVDGLVFVSQTPDHLLPATACTLQERLGLPTGCAAFDVSLGCSGYVYGLWLAGSVLQGGGLKRVLLLVGDTSSKLIDPSDRSTALLFGDAGSATLLERSDGGGQAHFTLGTDGSGRDRLIVPASGFRRPAPHGDADAAGGSTLPGRPGFLFMDGAEVFSFTLARVPGMVASTIEAAGWTKDDVDSFLFHQANRFMLRHLAKKMGLPAAKVPLSLEEFGNTSSASIPLTMVVAVPHLLRHGHKKLLLAGFGVGFSWAAAAIETRDLVVPDLIDVADPGAGDGQ